MKEKKKKKGGQRAGAGRKPSGRQKEAVTVYTDVSKFGGKEGARMAIYEFLDGKINLTGKSSFVPLDITPSIQKKFPPSDLEIKQKAPKEEKKPALTNPKPQDQLGIKLQPQIHPDAPMVTNKPPKTLDELKALCPFPEKTQERSDWVRTERQKYGI